MLFHYVLNTFLVFILLAGLVEVFLFLFRPKHARLRYFCRLLPLLKVPFDLLFFEFYGESVLINFNPFSCDVYFQQFLKDNWPKVLDTSITTGTTLIIPEYLAQLLPAVWLNAFLIVVGIASCMAVVRKGYLFFQCKNYFQSVLQSAEPCNRIIYNAALNHRIKQLDVRILTSPEVKMPCAAYLRYILLPDTFADELGQDEFEAVLVHEIEHLRWKDPVLKLCCGFVAAFFWWLPTGRWLQRLEIEQEEACDAEIHRYGIDVQALATALVKTVKNAKYLDCQFSALCPLDSPKTEHFKRLNALLNSEHVFQKGVYSQGCIVAVCLCAAVCMCFWAC